ncbi:AAEL002507-PA [Aedes aegypti]|uniref:AAEL002507-PA n=1 Tax=Aedes aegypti TaxID=7159 RepID=Q17HZ3_AEDAE|nr:AAEL002507-PA [Aedes aegypti]
MYWISFWDINRSAVNRSAKKNHPWEHTGKPWHGSFGVLDRYKHIPECLYFIWKNPLRFLGFVI